MKEKSMYGKKYMGIERSTFIIDEKGVLVKEYRNVKAASAKRSAEGSTIANYKEAVTKYFVPRHNPPLMPFRQTKKSVVSFYGNSALFSFQSVRSSMSHAFSKGKAAYASPSRIVLPGS